MSLAEISSVERRLISSNTAHNYILVMMKLPEPVQPAPPVKDHVPEIVFPFAVPDKVRTFPLGDPDVTFN